MQSRLFPDPRPLVERLGSDFFRQLPETPGVYLMHDRTAAVLYVGKAKNLRKRVCSYRVANPERMPRRTLRLLRLVESIHWEECIDEGSALRRETELLLALKPRFNRMGVWPGPKRFLVWRCTGGKMELGVAENPEAGWQTWGPLGSKAEWLRQVLLRLMWFSVNPQLGFAGMPIGWANGQINRETSLLLGSSGEVFADAMAGLCGGEPEMFRDLVHNQVTASLHPFLRAAVDSDLDLLNDLLGPRYRGHGDREFHIAAQ